MQQQMPVSRPAPTPASGAKGVHPTGGASACNVVQAHFLSLVCLTRAASACIEEHDLLLQPSEPEAAGVMIIVSVLLCVQHMTAQMSSS